jgi:hypothetical protein
MESTQPTVSAPHSLVALHALIVLCLIHTCELYVTMKLDTVRCSSLGQFCQYLLPMPGANGNGIAD